MRASRHWDERRVMSMTEVEHRFGESVKPCPFCNCPVAGLWVGPSPHGEVVVIKAGTALDLLAPDGPITVETLPKPGQ